MSNGFLCVVVSVTCVMSPSRQSDGDDGTLQPEIVESLLLSGGSELVGRPKWHEIIVLPRVHCEQMSVSAKPILKILS